MFFAKQPASTAQPLPDIWRILEVQPRPSPKPARTDVYVPCSPRSGVKLRYGRTLELKLRLENHDNGAEKWQKVIGTASIPTMFKLFVSVGI